MLVDFSSIAVLSAHILAGTRQGPFPPPALPGFVGSTDPSAICCRRRWSSRIRRWIKLSVSTATDFPCCALSMSRTCCHHYPGGIVRCVSRSLPSRRRPSPLVWRVGSHNDGFGACSVFTRVTARAVRWPPEEVVSRSASGHSSPPDPPRVLPAGARVSRPGFSPGRTVHLDKAHTPTSSNVRCARRRDLPDMSRGKRVGSAVSAFLSDSVLEGV